MKSTDSQIQQLASTVKNLAKTQPTPSKPTIVTSGLKLLNLVLPEFTGKKLLDRFLNHLQNLLVSSNVPWQYWITYLKQQCIKDSRAYDALISAEKADKKLLGPDISKVSNNEFKLHFEACVKTLKEKCSKPHDQQIYSLLSSYYVMHQHLNEIVADFAHCLKNVLPYTEALMLLVFVCLWLLCWFSLLTAPM